MLCKSKVLFGVWVIAGLLVSGNAAGGGRRESGRVGRPKRDDVEWDTDDEEVGPGSAPAEPVPTAVVLPEIPGPAVAAMPAPEAEPPAMTPRTRSVFEGGKRDLVTRALPGWGRFLPDGTDAMRWGAFKGAHEGAMVGDTHVYYVGFMRFLMGMVLAGAGMWLSLIHI